MNDASLKPMIANLESLFSKFNDLFYDGELQSPVITISPDTTRGAYGWCTSGKVWKNQDTGFYEINMCAEYMTRSVEGIAETLLHEMAHLYNAQKGVKDTSRSGTYHNKRFKETAEKHGLHVGRDSSHGWAITTLNNEAKSIVDGISDKEFKIYRNYRHKSKQSMRKYICPHCICIIRATRKVNIVCGDCGVNFKEV